MKFFFPFLIGFFTFISIDSKAQIKNNISLIFLSGFEKSKISIYLSNKKIITKFVNSDESTGYSNKIVNILFKNDNDILVFKENNKTFSKVKLKKGYNFLYIRKKDNNLNFEFSNKLFDFE